MTPLVYDILKTIFTSLTAIVGFLIVWVLKTINESQKKLADQLSAQGNRLLKLETEHSMLACKPVQTHE
jgi:hypothetical protein